MDNETNLISDDDRLDRVTGGSDPLKAEGFAHLLEGSCPKFRPYGRAFYRGESRECPLPEKKGTTKY